MSSQTLQPIAVVGIGCRFPGAGDPDEYWEMIAAGGTAITKLPASRLDRSLYFHPEKGRIGSTYTELGGVVEETPFNHARFPIASELLETYDSVHLRMLEVCCEAVIDAGLDPLNDLIGSRTGVYIGNTSGSGLGAEFAYGTLASQVVAQLRKPAFDDIPVQVREQAIQRTIATIRSETPHRTIHGGLDVEAHDVSVLVNRAMKLDGPAVAVDAACASSLMSLAQAVYALQRGHLEMAIAGGCSFSQWFALILFSQARSISGTGTRPFNQAADGLISSDGYAAVVLKPLATAQADGSRILSVIRRLTVGSDGKGKSLWAPRHEGQVATVRRAYNGAISVGSLQYIECHATSTQVGDATELKALTEILGQELPPGARIPIGSVKGNIGHTLECAGLAGLLKTIQALRHGVIPPQPSIAQLNPEIPWNEIPLYVPSQAEPWPDLNRQGVRRAAVNAFGIGGLNGHVILDDRPEPQLRSQSNVPADVTTNGTAVSMATVPAVNNDDMIAVIGLGVIAPDAKNSDEFWSLVSLGRSALSEVTEDRWDAASYFQPAPGFHATPTRLGGFIRGYEFDWRKFRIPPKQIASSNLLQYMLLDAASQAFADAGLGDMNFPRERVAAVVGTIFGGDFTCQLQIGLHLPHVQRALRKALLETGVDESRIDDIIARYRAHVLEVYPALNDETGSFTSSTLASRLTKTFDLMGGGWAIDAADVSSVVTLQAASDLLLTGSSDMVLCAAGQRSMDITVFEQFGLQGNLSTDLKMVPAFDAAQNGGVPGEAIGVLLLRRLSDAERDGNRVRGVIRGIAVSFDDNDTAAGVRRNLQRLFPAGAAARIDAVETAHVASNRLDQATAEGLTGCVQHETALPLGSTAAQLGHARSTSGMMSVIKAILELEHHSITPAAGAGQPSELIRGSGGCFVLPQQMVSLGNSLPDGAGRVLISNLDPCGAVGHLTVEGVEERAYTASREQTTAASAVGAPRYQEIRYLRTGAATAAALEASIDSPAGFTTMDGIRLGIAAVSDDELQRKIAAATAGLTENRRRHVYSDNGIFITEPSATGSRVAVAFSGQGAQYTGMLTDWVKTSQAVRDFIQEANQALADLRLPSYEFLTQDDTADLGRHVLNTQLAVLLADLASWAALQAAGVRPDFIAGHSYGEFPALVAAGAWDLRSALLATLHRTHAVESAGVTNAAMVSTTAPPESVSAILQELHLTCDIACYNAPDQTIIAGRISDLDRLSETLKTLGFSGRTIRVPMPYHSRLMQPAQEPLAKALRGIPVQAPAIRCISCGSLQPLDTPDQIRDSLVGQLADPVRWQALVETLIASEVSVIIESGPRQVLTRLNRQIIGDRPVMHMAMDARPGHSAEQRARIGLLLEMVQPRADSSSTTAINSPGAAANPVGAGSNGRMHITGPEKDSMNRQLSQSSGRIVWVDATERRRTKMREAAQAKAAGRVAPAGSRVSSNGAASATPAKSGNGVPAAPVATSSAQTAELSRDKLESFVLDYVVEQTGYPPEIVELDADMEADLGIDSIRKAQLLGEIAESFEIREAAKFVSDMSLDDFPTLDSVIKFFLKLSHSLDASATAVAVPAQPRPAAPVTPSASPVARVVTGLPREPAHAAPAPTAAPTVEREELLRFSVNFVVEQTGYPEELVEPDADLEADLGIDSIRKAQLLGEVAENYQMTHLANHVTDMSLDDFPTLNAILDFFVVSQADGGIASATPAAAPAVATPASAGVTPIAPAPVTSAVSPAAARASIFQPVPSQTVAVTPPSPATFPAVGVTHEELMRFAVNFVVEQTGYPEELVEPDADLEADLGIDSIRKAQLLGEIAEHYQMVDLASHVTDMSLDDFPTLEAITDFFSKEAGRTAEHGIKPGESRPADVEAVVTLPVANPQPISALPLAPFDRVPESDRLMHRYVMQAIPEPLAETIEETGTVLSGHVVVLGSGPDAEVLVERLRLGGSVVGVVTPGDNWQTTVAEFEACWNREPVDHLLLLTSGGEQPSSWSSLRNQQLLTPYFVIQRWVQLRLEAAGKAVPPVGILAAITRMGGDFALSRRVGNVSGAALTGLLKGILREHGELIAKVIDAPADEPIRLVLDCLFREVASGESTIEIGCIRGSRHRIRMIARPASTRLVTERDFAGAWVLTGGARGITARIASGLGRTPGVRLHLVGRSPEPDVNSEWRYLDEAGLCALKKDIMRQAAGEGKKPIEVWNFVSRAIDLDRSLHELRSQGLDLTYHSCDVGDYDAAAVMLQKVRELHGPVRGIVHGAGVESAARFDRKKPDSVVATLAGKVDGARWLWDLTAEDDLAYFVGFGSTSGRFGGLGQTDYSMASDLLCRMCSQFGAERPGCRVFGIHWPPWDEIGMAVRPESRFALEVAGLKFLSPNEGISHLLDELEIDAAEGEVAFVERVWEVPDAELQWDAEMRSFSRLFSPDVRNAPLIDGVIDRTENGLTVETFFDPDTCPMLRDHLCDGVPVVPATVLLELCLQTAALLDRDRVVIGAQDHRILNGVRCHGGRRQRLVVHAVRDADGVIRCEVQGEFCDQKNRVVDPQRLYASVIVLTATAPSAGTPAGTEVPQFWEDLQLAAGPDSYDSQHVGTVYKGPSLARLRGIAGLSEQHGWFRIAAPNSSNTPSGMDRPAILDALLQALDVALHRLRGTRQLPVAIGRLDQHVADLTDQNELAAFIRLIGEDSDLTLWTVQCFAAGGQAVVTMTDVQYRAMKSSPGVVAPAAIPVPSPSTAGSRPATAQRVVRPLMSRATVTVEGNSSVVTLSVNSSEDRFVSEHTFRGVPLLPAVMMLEIIGEAAETLAIPGERTIAFRGMRIHSGIKCPAGVSQRLVVRSKRSGETVAVQLFKSDSANRPCSECTVLLGTKTLTMETKIPAAHGEFADYPYRPEAEILHGPAYQTLKRLAPYRFQGTAELRSNGLHLSQDFSRDAEWIIDPAIVDGVIVACGTDAWLYYGNVLELPYSVDEILVGAPPAPGEACVGSFNCRTKQKSGTTAYDVVMQDAAGRTFVQIRGFALRRLMPGKLGLLIPVGL